MRAAAALVVFASLGAAPRARADEDPRGWALTGHLGFTLFSPDWLGLQGELALSPAWSVAAYGDLNPWAAADGDVAWRAALQGRWYFEGDTWRGGGHMAPTFQLFDGAPGVGLVVGQRVTDDGFVYDWQLGYVYHWFEDSRSTTLISVEEIVINVAWGWGGPADTRRRDGSPMGSLRRPP
ncbi:MAG: hypothetical protein H6704_25220 [Myxococcales bacterium]|nr:hypothetical protein [Myxococcales bacterium]